MSVLETLERADGAFVPAQCFEYDSHFSLLQTTSHRKDVSSFPETLTDEISRSAGDCRLVAGGVL